MATIKGITVQIGSDTTGLQAALKDVNQHSREIASELRQVERLLKFNPHDTDLLAQKQKLLADQVDNTRKKLETLKTAQEQVNEQFAKGEISEGQHRAFQRELTKTESQLKHYEKQLRAVNLENHEFTQRMGEMGQKLQDIGSRMSETGKTLSTRLTAPLLALGAVAGKAAIDFESAFAGVRKAVDATEAEFATLENSIRQMAKEIPASANEIARVAESAGQLGIATEHIADFSRVVIDLGETTNMSADQAATSLARLANITQLPQTEFDRLGSTVLALGNSLATTESEIVDMSLGLAGAGKQIGMTEAQILAFAGSLSSVGIAAQAGGSSFSRLMIDMQLAVETSNEKLQDFARVAGMSTTQFQKAFQDDAAGAIIAFVQGLQLAEEQGTSAIKVLDDMGITEVRMRDALLRAAGAGDLFAESIALGTKAWEENTALTDKAAERYDTTAAKLAIMRNKLQDVAITFGEILLPPLIAVIEKVGAFADWLSALSPALQKTIVIVGALAAAVGPLVLIAGQLVSAVGTILPVLGTLAAFIKTTLIPAIMGINWPVVAAVGAIAALATVAYEVYHSWDEVKTALLATWELLTIAAQQGGLKTSLAFEEMKHSVIGAINEILERMSVLENLPFGLGEKFAGLKESVGDGVEGSAQKIEELGAAVEANSTRMGAAVEKTKVAFGDLGAKIAEDVKGVVAAITGQTAVAAEELDEQTATLEAEVEKRTQAISQGQRALTQVTEDEGTARVDATQETEEEQTEIVSKEAQKRAEERAKFEADWSKKLFQLTADRLAQLDAEMAEVLAKAETLEADKTAIIEYYAIKRQEILDQETDQEREREQKRLDTLAKFEEGWARKLFETTASKLELLEKEKNEALALADELGADKTAIMQYYALQQQKILDEETEAETRRNQQRLDTLAQFEQQWQDRLFQATATSLEILENEKQEALAKAEELGADKTAIIEYYALRQQKIQEEQAKATQAATDEEAETLAAFQEAWTQKAFEQSATRLEQLEREKQEALALAEEMGADKTAILEYYAEEERRLQAEAQVERERLAERWQRRLFELKADELEILEAQMQAELELAEEHQLDITAIVEYYEDRRQQIIERRQKEAEAEKQKESEQARALADRRAQFEESWTRKVFQQTADRIERLRWERDRALVEAEKLGADKTAIVEFYAEEEKRVLADLQAERDAAREREVAAEQQKQRERERQAGQWDDRLFRQTATELQILEAQKEKELQLAEELGLEKNAIIDYYENERQKILDQQRAEQEKADQDAAKKTAEAAEAQEQARLAFEQSWSRKLFETTADSLEILEREKQEAVKQAEELGADTTAILEYYAGKELEMREKRAEETRKIAEAEAETERKRIAEMERARLAFETSWEGRLFRLTATREELLEHEKQMAVAKAEELGADTTAILEYYAQRQAELADIPKNRWIQAADDIGKAFEKMAIAVGDMWVAGTDDWEKILLNFVRTATNHIIVAAVGAMGIAKLVSQAMANMWNPAGWVVIGGLLIALAAIQRNLQQKLGTKGGGGGEGGGGGGGGPGPAPSPSGGRQVSEITGPTRDLLTDLLAPLAQLGQIVAPIQDIRSILDARLPDFNQLELAGAGGVSVSIDQLVVQTPDNSPNSIANTTVDTIERLIAEKLAFAQRGRGGR